VTANNLTAKALQVIGLLAPGEVLKAEDAQLGFDTLADMIDGWAAVRLTIFQTGRTVFPLTGGKGGPLNPYTIGPGGNFNQSRPLWIPNGSIQVATTNPPFEYPLGISDDDEYARTSIKALTSPLPRDLYFDAAFPTSGASAGLGNIILFPIPDGTLPLSLVLYTPLPLTAFADQNITNYSFPPGYAEALKYQLALRLTTAFGIPLDPVIADLAKRTFGVIQRPNAKIGKLRCDSAIAGHGGYYDWRTGTSRRRGD
jgi:hypothetical protein